MKAVKKTTIPVGIAPMLATPVKEPAINPEYVHEVKFDGYRIIAYKDKTQIRLDSRKHQNYTDKYQPITVALRELKCDVVLDGEICVLDENGIPNFDTLQKFSAQGGELVYYCFDLLWIDGENLMKRPLTERKARLKKLVAGNRVIRYSDHFDDGIALFEQMKLLGFEGIVSKKKDSLYQPGIRASDWLKVPAKQRQEFVIGGYAESERGRSFRSILFGAYNVDGKLEWVGRSGGGYKEREMPDILKKLKALEVAKSPFVNKVLDTKGAVIHYIEPKLVANFEFSGFTESGRIRKPAAWLGFRDDKDPREVVREIPKEAAVKNDMKEKPGNTKKKKKKSPYLNEESGWKKVDKEQEGAEWTDFKMPHCTIPVHNLDKELWEGVPKGRLLLYYSEMADVILPYIKDRPQSLNLQLARAGTPRVFIKDMENRQPDCATVFTDERRARKPGKRSQIDYLVCNNIETLIYIADLGCIDVNPWASRTTDIEKPDYIWLDLDPTIAAEKDKTTAEDKGFQKAIEVALACKNVLNKYKLTSFLKTSGKTGLHIYIPCTGLNFFQTRAIAGRLADDAHKLVPHISTREESINLRGDKVYIDAGQNDYADTLAAPYSIRPYHAPLVSTPLRWSEVKKGLDRYSFTIDTIAERVKRVGDLFKDVLTPQIAAKNSKILARL